MGNSSCQVFCFEDLEYFSQLVICFEFKIANSERSPLDPLILGSSLNDSSNESFLLTFSVTRATTSKEIL